MPVVVTCASTIVSDLWRAVIFRGLSTFFYYEYLFLYASIFLIAHSVFVRSVLQSSISMDSISASPNMQFILNLSSFSVLPKNLWWVFEACLRAYFICRHSDKSLFLISFRSAGGITTSCCIALAMRKTQQKVICLRWFNASQYWLNSGWRRACSVGVKFVIESSKKLGLSVISIGK